MELSSTECWHANILSIDGSHLLGAAAGLVAGCVAYWWLTRPSSSSGKLIASVDLTQQTKELPDGSRVAAFIGEEGLHEYNFKDARTLHQAIRRGLRESNNGPMLGIRKKQPDGSAPYVWLTYQEVIDRSVDLTYGISTLGIKPGQQTFIGIYSKNRPEWIISEYAAYNNSSVIVSLYDTLGVDARSYIIQQCAIELIICDNVKKAASLITNRLHCPSLKFIVIMDDCDVNIRETAKQVNIQLLSLTELEKAGRELTPKPELIEPKPSDLCTICYTSGTTGTPKGAMLTHANIIAASTSYEHFPNRKCNADDVSISYLPLAHMYERLLHCIGYQVGLRFGFFGGDVNRLIDDIKELHPTVIPLVPRVLNRFHDTVMAKVNKSFLKRIIFNLALAFKYRELSRSIIRNDSLVDRYVFKRVREELGGRARFSMIGSAPVHGDIMRFSRAVLGYVIVEGYGATECAAGTSAVIEADPITEHIGIPLACAAIKLVDVPELGYYAKDQAGEICYRGAHVFKGYFKNDEGTREVLDADGWLHSGDIGRWTERGTLKIVDRKKHIFKLQQGEYIAPEKIEAVYDRSEYVVQSFVYGESLKTCLVAIIVPDQEIVLRDAKQKLDLAETDFAKLCRNDAVKKMILNDLIIVGRKAGLNSFEQVKDIYLSVERFTIANDLLTPTMKNKRPQIKSHFMKELNEMYSKLK